ncbi:MAG: aminotransferase class I/II-fold pyridoxal phosphate-dependent enzyme [Candidatus Omnitrophica bacterium]|nr:aminotransferase class I/II-fold pyridoxal phosphate-dependent enzyme [Candidatus Omnitrophota bacterium]MBD3268567.1 aminotransferase class I/II-fold pyridoxal phosphate-dependent enzyme [Candidatus Omnitrophota bacterium]
MKNFDLSERLKGITPYLFAEIDRKKSALRKKKVKFTDLSIGDPDLKVPGGVVKALYRESSVKANQKYAMDRGNPVLRGAIRQWFLKRFGVKLSEDTQILPLLGSKEGLVHFPLAAVNRGDYVLIPSPGYPGYRSAAILSGGRVCDLPLLAKNGFLPDLKKIPERVRNKAKLMYLNYPNNPTTALASAEFLQKLVKFCSKYGIILAYDNAYSEIYFEEKPLSVLQIKGAEEIALEFHSFSKTFCMTGFRLGWACGNSALIKMLLKVKSNIDSGVFTAMQLAGAQALKKEKSYVDMLRKTFKERRDIFVSGIKEDGFTALYADSTFYVWAKIPSAYKGSMEFAEHLLLSKKIVATPGIGFGKYGEGFIRFALTVDKDILGKVIKRKIC